MKKTLLSIAIVLLFIATSHSQKIKVGANAGGTLSGFRGQNTPALNNGPGFGFLAGLTFEYGFNDRLSLRINPAYHRKSSKGKSQYETKENFDENWIVHDQTITFNYDYVSLPIMVKYNVGEKQNFFLSGGIFAAYLLKSEARSKSNPPPPDSFGEAPMTTTSSNNKVDFGLSVGLGRSIAIGDSNALIIELRDDFGLAKVGKYTNTGSNSLNLLLGWSFEL